jgi:hypothetical protein
MNIHHSRVGLVVAQKCRTSQNSPSKHRLCSGNQMGLNGKSSASCCSHKKPNQTSIPLIHQTKLIRNTKWSSILIWTQKLMIWSYEPTMALKRSVDCVTPVNQALSEGRAEVARCIHYTHCVRAHRVMIIVQSCRCHFAERERSLALLLVLFLGVKVLKRAGNINSEVAGYR